MDSANNIAICFFKKKGKKEKKSTRKRKMSSIYFRHLWGGQARIFGIEDV